MIRSLLQHNLSSSSLTYSRPIMFLAVLYLIVLTCRHHMLCVDAAKSSATQKLPHSDRLFGSCPISTLVTQNNLNERIRRPSKIKSVPIFSNLFLSQEFCTLRGGAIPDEESDLYSDEDEDDEEYTDDEEEDHDEDEAKKEAFDHPLIDLPPPPPESTTTTTTTTSPSYGGTRYRHSSSSSKTRKYSQPIKRPKKPAHWSQKLATQSIQMTSQLAWNTLIKQPTKLAYHMIRPKYVHVRETDGLWRLDQQITENNDRVVASVATIELQARPRIAILRKQQQQQQSEQIDADINKDNRDGKEASSSKPTTTVIKAPYTFTKKRFTGSFQTQFVLPAFLIGDNEMRLYGYKGTWQRKLADKRVIKLVGKIYQVYKQRFGKQRGDYVFGQAVGTFVMRRRIRLQEEEEHEEEEDDDDFSDVDEEGWVEGEEEWDEDDE